MMGSCARRAWAEILAGVEANCGLEANVVRLSTASTNGRVFSAQARRLVSFRLPARACVCVCVCVKCACVCFVHIYSYTV